MIFDSSFPGRIACGLGAALLLAACTASTNNGGPATSKMDAAIERAAIRAEQQSGRAPSLSSAERAYTQNANATNAIVYAAALREAGQAGRAITVLEPFAKDAKAAPGARTEFAALQLALGNSESAERYARKAVAQDAQDARAQHYLGIALDAQGKHEDAEKAFRKALDLWQGDPTPVMNNLALNLSAQGYLDEAAEILEKAIKVSPNRTEIERNLRIVMALRQSERTYTPKPGHKPKPPA